jgi:hypothetical protein
MLPKFDEFLNPETLSQVTPEEVPGLLVQLSSIQTMLAAKLLAVPEKSNGQPIEPDTFLTAEEAAARLSVTPHWLYRHWKQLPFSRRLSRKSLRFSENGLRKWQSIKKA